MYLNIAVDDVTNKLVRWRRNANGRNGRTLIMRWRTAHARRPRLLVRSVDTRNMFPEINQNHNYKTWASISAFINVKKNTSKNFLTHQKACQKSFRIILADRAADSHSIRPLNKKVCTVARVIIGALYCSIIFTIERTPTISVIFMNPPLETSVSRAVKRSLESN